MVNRNQPIFAALLIIVLVISAIGQSPKQTTEQKPEESVIKIDTNLVQIDAVVTDKNGRPVTDLKPEEFEILEDGRPQKITNFSFVSLPPATSETNTTNSATNVKPSISTAATVPPAQIRPEQVRRTTALLVDDLSLSFDSIVSVRDALKKYIDSEVQPGDFVAIVSTSGKIGIFQQFTADKQQLYHALERISFRGDQVSAIRAIMIDPGFSSGGDDGGLREQIFNISLLNTIEYLLKGLAKLPGRKSVVLFSEGFQLYDPEKRLTTYLQRLTDLANRASVVIYTADTRGLATTELSSRDDVGFATQRQIRAAVEIRNFDFSQSQEGLRYLAAQTGGIFFNSNYLINGIKKAVEDQNGFYLLGYDPDESTFKPVKGNKPFHKLEIKVKRAGLTVHARHGFLGLTDEEARQSAPHTRAEQLFSALSSPFGSNDISLRLTGLFSHDQQDYIHSLIYIDGEKITFTDEPDGWHNAVFDILAVAFGENGESIYQINKTHTIRVRGDEFTRVQRDGIAYIVNVPIKKAGAYQLRVAVRDTASERIGTASQFSIVPDLKKGKLTLSGILLSGSDVKAAQANQANPPAAPAGTNNLSMTEEAESKNLLPALRRFQRGMALNYLYHIYNAQQNHSTPHPQLKSQARLYHNGQLFFTGNEIDLSGAQQLSPGKYLLSGGLQLGTEMEAGEYVLEVTVTDPSAKPNSVKQVIDFEIVK